MPNLQKDDLFQLIKSLGKGEKRNFKLYMQRNSALAELKVVQLFDAMDKVEEYDEVAMLRKNPSIAKQQLSNLKASLYRHILTSLRLIKDPDNIDMQMHEMLDHVRILYNKGLYLQSLHILDRVKQTAQEYYQFTYLEQAIFFEKKIEAMYITRSMNARADTLADESELVQKRLQNVNKLSNLSLQLYSWYIKHGHARNNSDRDAVEYYFKSHVPPNPESLKGFYEKLYYYQSQSWLSFIVQDYLKYYRYSQRWVDLYHAEPAMIKVETIQYIKGMHNLLGAHYDLKNADRFYETLQHFEAFYQSPVVQVNENYKIQSFVYLYISKIHKHYLEGTFSEGLNMVPEILDNLELYNLYIDRHRVLVFYYKIACLYFGSGDNEKTIDFLNKIINLKADLRLDLQCYARLLHLIAHFELGNHSLIPYLIKSVYRFMTKMENLSHVEVAMLKFLRESLQLSVNDVKPKLRKLLGQLKRFENNASEARAFAYLDIVSWLESKLENKPVEFIIRQKFVAKQNMGTQGG
ncbi:MAG TPA: hypothetical protein VLC98_06280 [Phnomibacter sp.]|nr:hypothetical protein [Phnomibacter sp.]